MGSHAPQDSERGLESEIFGVRYLLSLIECHLGELQE